MLKSCSLHGSWACTVFIHLCDKCNMCFRFWKHVRSAPQWANMSGYPSAQDVTCYFKHISALTWCSVPHISPHSFTPAQRNQCFIRQLKAELMNCTSSWMLHLSETKLGRESERHWQIKSNHVWWHEFHGDWWLRNPWLTASSANQKVSGNNRRQRGKLPSLALFNWSLTQWHLGILKTRERLSPTFPSHIS